MAEGNGDASSQNDTLNSSAMSKDYSQLIELGLSEQVAAKLSEIYSADKLAHSDLDERALDALREFPVDGALVVLSQLFDANLQHVSNKSAYLCSAMKTYRQKGRLAHEGSPPAGHRPNQARVDAILQRTGYSLDVTTGQRKYGGPPPNWHGKPPGVGCEVFCGKIPKDIFEDELIPLFEQCGDIWDLRLMMDPMSGLNRGYAFVTFTAPDAAKEAVKQFDGYEIRKFKAIKVNISVPNLRLFVGNIPKSKDRDEILEEFGKLTDGLVEAIIYSSPDDKKKNRGFCFLEYESHKMASLARRRLCNGRVKAWNCEIIVDWADPQEEPDSDTMAKVKVLYARNLTQECTEDKLREAFQEYGQVERVKKIKDYAFIHFVDRAETIKAMEGLNGAELCGSVIDVSLAKPPSDKRKKEEVLRNRERRMLSMMAQRGMVVPLGVPLAWHHAAYYNRGGGGNGGYYRAPMMSGRSPMTRPDYGMSPYDVDYDMYGYVGGYFAAAGAGYPGACYGGYPVYSVHQAQAPPPPPPLARPLAVTAPPLSETRPGVRGRFRPAIMHVGGRGMEMGASGYDGMAPTRGGFGYARGGWRMTRRNNHMQDEDWSAYDAAQQSDMSVANDSLADNHNQPASVTVADSGADCADTGDARQAVVGASEPLVNGDDELQTQQQQQQQHTTSDDTDTQFEQQQW